MCRQWRPSGDCNGLSAAEAVSRSASTAGSVSRSAITAREVSLSASTAREVSGIASTYGKSQAVPALHGKSQAVPPNSAERMNEFLRKLLSVFSILECTNSFSLTRQNSDNVHSEEVKFENPHSLPQCWGDIKPVFNLLTRRVTEGLDLSHIVVLIHGFDSRPSIWADELARVILNRDVERKELGVLVINWEWGSR